MFKKEVESSWDNCWALLCLEQATRNNVEDRVASLATQGRREFAGEQELDTKSFATFAHKQLPLNMQENLERICFAEEKNM